MRIAVVIPVYNERALLPITLSRLDETPPPRTRLGQPTERTIIIVDDGSTDGTRDFLAQLDARDDIPVILKDRNEGKGSAIARGFAATVEHNADIALIQDADLEYDPADHEALLRPILEGRADAVIGSRFIGQSHRVLYYWHSIANRVITTLSNMLSNLNLTDIECGLKAFNRPVLERLSLKEKRFGVEPEIIAKLARMTIETDPTDPARPAGPRRLRVYEVPVTYAGRTYAEGKKIGWRDGIEAIRCIIQRNLLR